MQCVRIGQDNKESPTKSGRVPNRRKAEEVDHRCDGIFQSSVTIRVPGFWFLNVFAEHHNRFVFVDLLKAKTEALDSLKNFFLIVGKPKSLSQNSSRCTAYVQAVNMKDHTRDATTDWVKWEAQQETAGDGMMPAYWPGTFQDDVGSSNSSLREDQKHGCETRRGNMSSRAHALYKI